jgi:hypothetical protein
MKINIISIALLSLSALFPLIPSLTSPANACTQTTYGVQTRVSGEKNPQAGQNYNSNQTNDPNCFNNNVVSGGVQTSVGEKAPEQNLENNTQVGGGNINQTGITTPNVNTDVNVQTDVYSPAHDPEFMKDVMQQP